MVVISSHWLQANIGMILLGRGFFFYIAFSQARARNLKFRYQTDAIWR